MTNINTEVNKMTENVYKQNFTVHYYEIDKDQHATPSSILQYVEDVSMGHSIKIGYGLKALLDVGLCWIVNKWHVVMDRYPKWNETITMETWVCNYQRFLAKRDYRIKDMKGNILGNITSRWIFYNYLQKKPQRILPEIINGYGRLDYNAVEDDFKKIILPENWEYEKKYNVRRSDIDTNKHVNNIKYVEWICDTIPESVYENCQLREFEIVYNHESGLDSNIISKANKLRGQSNVYEYIHGIFDNNRNINVAGANTKWVDLNFFNNC